MHTLINITHINSNLINVSKLVPVKTLSGQSGGVQNSGTANISYTTTKAYNVLFAVLPVSGGGGLSYCEITSLSTSASDSYIADTVSVSQVAQGTSSAVQNATKIITINNAPNGTSISATLRGVYNLIIYGIE